LSSTEEEVTNVTSRRIIPKLLPKKSPINESPQKTEFESQILLSAVSREEISEAPKDQPQSFNFQNQSFQTSRVSENFVQRVSQSNFEFLKRHGGLAFKPSMCRVVQPSDPCEENLECSVKDLSRDRGSSHSQVSTFSQESETKRDALPVFTINIDSESNLSHAVSITPKSLSKLEVNERRLTGTHHDNHLRPPIDTNVDVLALLENNQQLLDFHLRRSADSARNPRSEKRVGP
jgi:hypothetical protein